MAWQNFYMDAYGIQPCTVNLVPISNEDIIAATARRNIESNDSNAFGSNETITGDNINDSIERIDVSTNTTFSESNNGMNETVACNNNNKPIEKIDVSTNTTVSVSTIDSSTMTEELKSDSSTEKKERATNTDTDFFNSFGSNETIAGNNNNKAIDRIDVSTNTTVSVSTKSTMTVKLISDTATEKKDATNAGFESKSDDSIITDVPSCSGTCTTGFGIDASTTLTEDPNHQQTDEAFHRYLFNSLRELRIQEEKCSKIYLATVAKLLGKK